MHSSPKKTLQIWHHPYFFHGVFIFFLFLGFVIRYALFYQNFNIEDGDITSVYHIANHIITYHELPIIGEPNSIYTLLPHSPLYFYLTALGLLIHNSIFTLGVMGMLLQFVYIVLLYALAFVLFNKSVALLTGLILVGNQQFIAQTHVMYQRWFEQPFFAASYLFLALAYTKKNYAYTLYAAICFTIALGIGLHGYAALPVFLFLIGITLHKTQASLRKYITVGIIMIGIWSLCYATVLGYLTKNNHLFFAFQESVYTTSITGYLREFILNIGRLFYGTLYSDLLPPIIQGGSILLFLSIVGIAALRKKLHYSPYLLSIITYIFSIILIASFLQKDTRDYHFVAAFGPFIILLSALTQSFVQKAKSDKINTIICTMLLLIIGAPSTRFLQQNQQKQDIYIAQLNAAKSTTPYIQQLRQENASWPNQTSIELYGNTIIGPYDPTDNIFWPIFEKIAYTKLSQTTSGITTPLTRTPDNIFVICSDYKSVQHAEERCNKAFLTRHPNFESTLIYTGDSDGKYILYIGKRKKAPTSTQ